MQLSHASSIVPVPIMGSNPTPSAIQSHVFSLRVLFCQKYCFCGRLRASLTRAGALFFYTLGEWLAFGQSFSVALTTVPFQGHAAWPSISGIPTSLPIATVTETHQNAAVAA
jgi:hypothetical protein